MGLHLTASRHKALLSSLGVVLRATYRTIITLAFVLSLSIGSFAATIKARYHRTTVRHARHLRWMPVLLKGSHDSLLRQNAEIDSLQLPRIQNDQALEELIAHDQLVGLPENHAVRIDPRIEASRRFCRPWTRHFLEDFGQAYYK